MLSKQNGIQTFSIVVKNLRTLESWPIACGILGFGIPVPSWVMRFLPKESNGNLRVIGKPGEQRSCYYYFYLCNHRITFGVTGWHPNWKAYWRMQYIALCFLLRRTMGVYLPIPWTLGFGLEEVKPKDATLDKQETVEPKVN